MGEQAVLLPGSLRGHCGAHSKWGAVEMELSSLTLGSVARIPPAPTALFARLVAAPRRVACPAADGGDGCEERPTTWRLPGSRLCTIAQSRTPTPVTQNHSSPAQCLAGGGGSRLGPPLHAVQPRLQPAFDHDEEHR
eukprot:gene14161-biopygen13426